ncbi:MAG: M14 family metallopeptidase [Pseudomonadota bacterium]
MNLSDCFSDTYREARNSFLRACEAKSIHLESHEHPLLGIDNEAMFADVAEIGRPGAEDVIVLVSGTHGIEGYCGSGIQIGCLQMGLFDKLPGNIKVLLIHGLNPYGFSYYRRVNEDNIDVNRNFIDFDAPLPINTAYADVQALVLPEGWDGESRAAAEQGIKDYIADKGAAAYQAALTGGQYQYPEGLFFGGAQPSWSRRLVEDVLSMQCKAAQRVAILDVHTGLGEYGEVELITFGDQLPRAQQCYGEAATSPDAGSSSSAVLAGTFGGTMPELLPHAEVTYVALEYGTSPVLEVMEALRAENWLRQRGELDSELGERIKEQFIHAFYPNEPQWHEMVWERAVKYINMALLGMNR